MKSHRPPGKHIPQEILIAEDYEALAAHFLETGTHAYIAGGSGHEQTLRNNRQSFEQIQVLPRPLRPLSQGHTRLSLLGKEYTHPILLAPVAYQSLAHPEGELETARGAAAMEATLIVSTLATTPLEMIAASTPQDKWFQLYIQPERAVTVDLIKRAEMAGYSALVITVDATIKQPSLRAQRLGFQTPPTVRAVNLDRYPSPETRPLKPEESRIFQGIMRESPGWDDLVWIRESTRLPILIKGILHPDGALRLQSMGMNGLIVSNHGGRTVDGMPATIDRIAILRQAVGPDFPLLLDSGIRSGSDIFKAIALGANAVLIGRLQVYALAIAGALGVAHLIRTLREELELCMAQCGCATLADIGPDFVIGKETAC